MSVRRNADGTYSYRKRVRLPDGSPHRIFGSVDENGKPFTTKRDAEDAEHVAIEELKRPRLHGAPTLTEWFEGRFWTEWVLGGPRGANSPSEQEAKRLIFGKWLRPVFGPLSLDRIDAQVINTFRARLRGMKKPDGSRQLAEKTINNILAVLSTPLQYAEKAGVLVRAPHVGVAKVERPEIEFIEFEEFAQLLAAARDDVDPDAAIMVLLAYEHGLRVGEVRAFDRSKQADIRGGTVTVDRQVRLVRNEDGKYRDIEGPPKGRRRRVIPMSPALRAAFAARLRIGAVERRTKEELRALMARLVKRAHLETKISGWHIGRHTFGTHAALLGVNPWQLQEWMGHRKIDETQLYADVARAHGRPVPPAILTAGANESDPARRIMAQLSARGDLRQTKRATSGQRRNPVL